MKASFGSTEFLAKLETGAAWGGGSTSPGAMVRTAHSYTCVFLSFLKLVMVALYSKAEDEARTVVEESANINRLKRSREFL